MTHLALCWRLAALLGSLVSFRYRIGFSDILRTQEAFAQALLLRSDSDGVRGILMYAVVAVTRDGYLRFMALR